MRRPGREHHVQRLPDVQRESDRRHQPAARYDHGSRHRDHAEAAGAFGDGRAVPRAHRAGARRATEAAGRGLGGGAPLALRGCEPTLPDALNDRQQDVWEPLFAIADQTGGDWPTRARKAAITLSGAITDDDDIGVQLLADAKVVFIDAGNPEVLPSKELVEQLSALEDRPWGAWAQGRPITQAKVARLLGGFGIVSHVIRMGPEDATGIHPSDLHRRVGTLSPLSGAHKSATPQQAQ